MHWETNSRGENTMAMEDLMKALMQGASGVPQQQSGGGGGDALSQMLGGLMGGGQQSGGAPAVQMLGALEQIIGGQPGTGQPLNANQGTAMNAGSMGMNDPVMMLLQPVVNQLAAKANISPQIAMVLASIAVHYLLSSHPSTPGSGPLNLGSVMQEITSGNISSSTLHDSGMVNDVMQATGLSKPEAVKSLNATFGALGAQAKGAVGGGRSTK
jgi:hypothetical protein